MGWGCKGPGTPAPQLTHFTDEETKASEETLRSESTPLARHHKANRCMCLLGHWSQSWG